MPAKSALIDLEKILASPTVVMMAETERHADIMSQLIRASGVSGNLVHDAHIAALCLEHGVSELITGDRDFLRFKGLHISNPFAD